MAKGSDVAKERSKLARRISAIYVAAVALAALVEELEGNQPTVKITLDGDSLSVSAGSIKFGAKSSGL